MPPAVAIDIVPRTIFDEVSKQIEQTVVIKNRPGAGTLTGSVAVAKSDPDGYTFLSTSAALTIAQAFAEKPQFDTARDFSGVRVYGIMPNVLVVAPSKSIRTVQELVAAARANPGALNYGSAGAGTPTCLNTLRFLASAGIRAQHIPFKVAPQALTELITGPSISFHCCRRCRSFRTGSCCRLRSAVRNGFPFCRRCRRPKRPDMRTRPMISGIVSPAKTDRAIVNRLHREIAKAIEKPTVREMLKGFGVEPVAMTPEQLDVVLKNDVESNMQLAKSTAKRANSGRCRRAASRRHAFTAVTAKSKSRSQPRSATWVMYIRSSKSRPCRPLPSSSTARRRRRKPAG